jgi:transposase
MRRDDICLYVSPANRSRLEAIMVDRNSSSKAVWRAEIVLATADGLGTNAIMKRTGKSKPCVWRWQERCIEEGVDGLLRDKTRPPGTKPLSAAIKREVLAKTASQTPPAATHWSVRTMAAEMGISHTSVQRIWAEAGLKPHLVSTFKISNDPQFELSDTTLASVRMPNSEQFYDDDREKTEKSFWNKRPCMKDCKKAVEILGRARVLDVTPESKTAPRVD